jgi:thiol-disulfide isomerase/thioredoxin
MKKLLLGAFLVIFCASSVFAMGFNEAKTMGKPIVVMFSMKGCSACKQISPLFDKMKSKFSEKFNFVKEDAMASDISKTLNFQTVPAIFIVEPKSMKAKRIDDNCAWDKTCFAQTLEKY